MLLNSILNGLQSRRKPRRANRWRSGRRPRFETLEDRCLLSLTPGLSYSVGAEPQAVVAADFNNDGRLDLATANAGGNTVSVLLGDGQGGFGAAIHSAAGDNPVSLAVGDFNSDGTLDLAAADGGGRGVTVMFGNRDGTFRAPMHIPVCVPVCFTDHGQRGPGSLATGDFNGDGKMDLVVTSNYRPADYYSYPQGFFSVLLSIGDGSFAAPRTFWWPDRALGSAVVTDFNGDGNQDLVTEMPDYSTILVLLGDGRGGFGGVATPAYSSNPAAAADLNGDGNIDLVSAPGPLAGYNAVGINLGDGNDSSLNVDPDYYAVGGTPDTAILGDFDRDGLLDIAATVSENNYVSILRGVGNGTFGTAENFAVGSGGTAATNGDINADGSVDAADYVLWRKNGGTPNQYNDWRANFGRSAGAAQDPRPVDLAMGDFNGDGWLDVATANRNANSVSILLSDQSWPVLPPAISVGDATVTEGHTGTVNATFAVTLSKVTNVDVTVHYSTADGQAVAGSDYVAASGIVTIPAGQTTATFIVAGIGDRVAEQDEYFSVHLSSPTNATIARGQALGTILDDEPRISINDVTKFEGRQNKTTLFTFTVTLSATYDQPVTMSYRTVDGTATTSDNDYVAKTGTLTFAPGETTKTITIEVKGDSKKELNETFYLDLFDNSSNSLFTTFRGIGTIWNDD